MTDVQKSPMNLLKEALKFGGFREEVFECENSTGERRLVPPFITSIIAGNLSLSIEFGEDVKSKNSAKRITYDILIKNMYAEEYELAYEDSADYADNATMEIPKAVMLKTKRESTVHHERIYKRLCKDAESNLKGEKNDEKREKVLARKKQVFDERMEAVTRNRFPTWEELDTIEDPEKVWYNRMMKATRAYDLDIDWDFEFDFADKENKKVTCTVQVHQKKEGEDDPTFLFKLDHSADLGTGNDEETGRFKTKGDFVRQIKGQLGEDIVNQLVTEGIMEDPESALAILKERSDALTEARLAETEEEREARIAKIKEERKADPKKGGDKKGDKRKTMRQKLKERREGKKNVKEDAKSKKKDLDEKIAAKKEKLKAKAKAKRDAKKGKKDENEDEEKPKRGGKAPAKGKKPEPKKNDSDRPQKTKADLRKFYLDTIKKVTGNDKLDEDKKKKLCDKYKKIYNEKVDALKNQPKAREPRERRDEGRDNRRGGRDNRDDKRTDRRNDRDTRDSRGAPKRGRDNDRAGGQPRGGKQMAYQNQVMYQPVMMQNPQMYAPPPAQAYQPQQVYSNQASYGYQQQQGGKKDNNFSSAQTQIQQLQAQQQAQMAQLQGQLQSYGQQAAAPRHPAPSGGRQQSGRRW